jgi:outer membrane biosynthesis protein TonB
MTLMPPGPFRHRLAPALIASVLLHLAVAAWLWLAEPRGPSVSSRVPEGAKSSLVELEFTDVPRASTPPPKVPAAAPVSAPRPATRLVRRQKPAEPVAERPSPAEPAQPQEDPPVAGAGEEDAPRKLVLVPSWPGGVPSTGAPAREPESRGRTLHPGDPALESESTVETSERLTARVQDWMDDGAAGARAGGIGKHPYFEQVRGSLEGALARTEGGDARKLGIQNPVAGILKNYTQAAEQYGQTGNPGGGSPPPAPLQSEQLAERFKDEPSARQMRMAAQARETLEALNSRGALLTVILELHQARSGELLDAKLTEPSGNPRFDAFVLRVVPGALGTLTPPPDEALRGRDFLRTQWQVEGWLSTPKALREAVSALASGQLMLPLDLLLQPAGPERPRFEYRARLLKVY